ncbi:MAG: XrtA system polysaccharide chain length determinant, partial [Chromatiaceae bacterium]
MQEIIRLALFYVSGIWRYRWFTLAAAAVICPIGWAYVATMPDEYEATARVFVDTDSVLTPLLRGLAIQTDDDRRVRMMTNVMFSRQNMEKLARMTDLDLRAKTPQDMDRLAAELKSRVHLGSEGNNIYNISFDDAKPDLAKRVVQSMLTIFVESNLGDSRQDQDSAEQFLKREIKNYERRLVEAERNLKEFKTRNIDVLSEKGSYYERLRAARDQLATAQEQLKLSTKRRDELAEQLKQVGEEGYDQWVDQSAEAVSSPTEERIKEMEAQVDELLLKYTDRHPDVIAMRETIERLKAKAKVERKEFLAAKADDVSSDEQTSSANANNPVYQQMRLVLSQAQADIAAQQSRVEALTKQVDDLQRAVDEGLKVEAQQKQLNRDYGILQNN